MKIFYAVQATGNGHISRAMELLPYLQQYGEVAIFLSGANSSLELQAPVKYRSKGCSLFYSQKGSLSYKKIISQLSPIRLWKEIRELPLEKYDLILNDFESITALACAYKKIPSVQFGHQASFMSSQVPLPAEKDRVGEWVLKNFARASRYVGLHFDCYDSFILPPVIKKAITQAMPTVQNYITVYLPAYADHLLLPRLLKIKHFEFEVFSRQVQKKQIIKNVRLLPVNAAAFNRSMIHCEGVITSAGFETPAEAMYLRKKLMVIPIRKQYEQQCNAAALQQMGVTVLKEINDDFSLEFCRWVSSRNKPLVQYHHTTEEIVNTAMNMALEKPTIHPLFYSKLSMT
jgi:uncharacterized protein (TIGR00661 family)